MGKTSTFLGLGICLLLATIVGLGRPASAASTHFYLPWKEGVSHPVIQGENGSASHFTTVNMYAFDFDLNGGEVWASSPGQIKAIVRNVSGQTSTPDYGNYVKIEHADGTCTRYAHMAYGTVINASVGDWVEQGEKLGVEGNTGYTLPVGSGYHLHFQRESCSSGNSQEVDFVEAAEPLEGHSYTSQNNQGGGEFDANPSAALSGAGSLGVNHTTRDEINSTRWRSAGATTYSPITTGVASGWVTSGSSDIASDPTQPDTFWVAALKDTLSTTSYGRLYVYEVENGVATRRAQLMVGSVDDQWSVSAPPSIIVDRAGNVYVAAVQVDGDMSLFEINPNSDPAYNVGRVDIGNSGAWSTAGTVNLALGPDDAIWLAAITKQSVSEVRTYKVEPHSLSASGQGTIGVDGWTVDAAPAIIVDNDGDVTVLAVKADPDKKGALWSFHNIDGQPNNWQRISDDVGANQEWSTQGSIDIGVNANDRIYVTGVRNPNNDGGELQVFMMQPGVTYGEVPNSIWSQDQQLGNGATTWSEFAAPAMVTSLNPDLSVWVVAVNRDGNLYAWKRNGSTGAWSSYGQIGGNGWAGNQL